MTKLCVCERVVGDEIVSDKALCVCVTKVACVTKLCAQRGVGKRRGKETCVTKL